MMFRLFMFFIVGTAIILGVASLSGCATLPDGATVAGVVNGREIITAAPVVEKRPHLRDNVRKDDIVCGEEPFGKVGSQKQINQNIKNKIAWGRECRRRALIGWKVIEQEP